MDELTNQAIQAALNRDWKLAISSNLALLKQNTKDTEALNRLARAYFETGLKTKAEETYKKVLKIDKFNTIALKNLDLLKTSRIVRGVQEKTTGNHSQAMFLEEPGVTRTVTLIRLGDAKIISACHPGDPVTVTTREHCVSVMSLKNQYLGRLPDDLAARLMNLMKNGNKYEAWIKSVSDGLKIFIKETYRGPKNRLTPSFPVTEKLTYAAFTPPELIHTEKPDVSAHEEQEEVDRDISDIEDNAPQIEIPRPLDD